MSPFGNLWIIIKTEFNAVSISSSPSFKDRILVIKHEIICKEIYLPKPLLALKFTQVFYVYLREILFTIREDGVKKK